MDLARAKQILDAEQKINVTLNGQPVWIDSIDTESRTAKIHAENNPKDSRIVPVQQLQEG